MSKFNRVSRREVLKKATATTMTGGVLVGSAGTASAESYDRSLTLTEMKGVETQYSVIIIPSNCGDKPESAGDDESNDVISRARGGWGINGSLNGGTDTWDFCGHIIEVIFESDGDALISWDASYGQNSQRGLYSIETYAQDGSQSSKWDITTHSAVYDCRATEGNDEVKPYHNQITSYVNGGFDYFDAEGQILGGTALPNGKRMRLNTSAPLCQ